MKNRVQIKKSHTPTPPTKMIHTEVNQSTTIEPAPANVSVQVKDEKDDMVEGSTEIIERYVNDIKVLVEKKNIENPSSLEKSNNGDTSPCILSEVDYPIITKKTIKINELVKEVTKHEPLSEINTIVLSEKIVANEECLLKITPLKNLPITHILSANLVFSNPLDNVVHQIVESDDPKCFLLYVKNNRNEDIKVKVCYNVMFS
jgi:hypothetical protein